MSRTWGDPISFKIHFSQKCTLTKPSGSIFSRSPSILFSLISMFLVACQCPTYPIMAPLKGLDLGKEVVVMSNPMNFSMMGSTHPKMTGIQRFWQLCLLLQGVPLAQSMEVIMRTIVASIFTTFLRLMSIVVLLNMNQVLGHLIVVSRSQNVFYNGLLTVGPPYMLLMTFLVFLELHLAIAVLHYALRTDKIAKSLQLVKLTWNYAMAIPVKRALLCSRTCMLRLGLILVLFPLASYGETIEYARSLGDSTLLRRSMGSGITCVMHQMDTTTRSLRQPHRCRLSLVTSSMPDWATVVKSAPAWPHHAPLDLTSADTGTPKTAIHVYKGVTIFHSTKLDKDLQMPRNDGSLDRQCRSPQSKASILERKSTAIFIWTTTKIHRWQLPIRHLLR